MVLPQIFFWEIIIFMHTHTHNEHSVARVRPKRRPPWHNGGHMEVTWPCSHWLNHVTLNIFFSFFMPEMSTLWVILGGIESFFMFWAECGFWPSLLVTPGGLDPRNPGTSSTRPIHCAITSDDKEVYFSIIYCMVERNSLNSILTTPGLRFESHTGWRGFESQWGICTL
jgi:hypothetical protein